MQMGTPVKSQSSLRAASCISSQQLKASANAPAWQRFGRTRSGRPLRPVPSTLSLCATAYSESGASGWNGVMQSVAPGVAAH